MVLDFGEKTKACWKLKNSNRGSCARAAPCCALHDPSGPDEARTARGCLHSGVNHLVRVKGRGAAAPPRPLGTGNSICSHGVGAREGQVTLLLLPQARTMS